VFRPGKPCISGHPKLSSCFDPLYWLSEKLHSSGFFLDECSDLSAPVYRERPPDNRRKAMDCATRVREPCRPRTALARHGGRVWVCRSHTDWTAQGRRVHPAPHQPACYDVWMWLTGRTFGTSGSQGMRIWFAGMVKPSKGRCFSLAQDSALS
jgi:hypothetical protein